MSPGGVGSSLALCPPGGVSIAGGWDGENAPPVDSTVGYNTRYTTGWGVIMINWASINATYHAFVVCGMTTGTMGSFHAQSADDQRAFDQDVQSFREQVATR